MFKMIATSRVRRAPAANDAFRYMSVNNEQRWHVLAPSLVAPSAMHPLIGHLQDIAETMRLGRSQQATWIATHMDKWPMRRDWTGVVSHRSHMTPKAVVGGVGTGSCDCTTVHRVFLVLLCFWYVLYYTHTFFFGWHVEHTFKKYPDGGTRWRSGWGGDRVEKYIFAIGVRFSTFLCSLFSGRLLSSSVSANPFTLQFISFIPRQMKA
jgi:hypothetical protein